MKENPKFDRQLDDLRKLKLNIFELRKMYDSLAGENKIIKNLKDIIIISDKIYQEVVANPENLNKIKNFNNYYIITVQKVLKQYKNLKDKKINTKEAKELYLKIENFMQNVSKSFEKIYECLFDDTILDVDAEIEVMIKEMKI